MKKISDDELSKISAKAFESMNKNSVEGEDGIWYSIDDDQSIPILEEDEKYFGRVKKEEYESTGSAKSKITTLIIEARVTLDREVLGIENREDLTDDEKVTRICTVFGTTCAAIAVQPIPFADFFVLTPIQALMGKKIADIRGFDISEAGAKEIFKEVAGLIGLGFLSQQLAIGAYKTVLPFISGFTTIPLVFGLTYGMGNVMDYYFVKKIKGEKVDSEVVKRIFEAAKAEGKRKAKENKEEVNRQKNSF